MTSTGWIGVDLDGTLAFYDHWRGPDHIGRPLKPMVNRVKQWLEEGIEVRIVTARLDGGLGDPECRDLKRVATAIEQWCLKHIGQVLKITNQKDYAMLELWDDRCVQMIPNTGKALINASVAEFVALQGKVAGQ